MTDNLQETESNAALLCPFCGARARVVDLDGWEVHCDCGAGMVVDSPRREDVLKAWNRRSADTCSRQCEGTAFYCFNISDFAARVAQDEIERHKPLMQAVEWILEDGHMNQEHLARLRAAWEAALWKMYVEDPETPDEPRAG